MLKIFLTLKLYIYLYGYTCISSVNYVYSGPATLHQQSEQRQQQQRIIVTIIIIVYKQDHTESIVTSLRRQIIINAISSPTFRQLIISCLRSGVSNLEYSAFLIYEALEHIISFRYCNCICFLCCRDPWLNWVLSW